MFVLKEADVVGITGMVFQLWRQDDNGNRFLVDNFAQRTAAERRLAELTRTPHKQTYWITERTDTNPEGAPSAQTHAQAALRR